jgi:hypothetical protein
MSWLSVSPSPGDSSPVTPPDPVDSDEATPTPGILLPRDGPHDATEANALRAAGLL